MGLTVTKLFVRNELAEMKRFLEGKTLDDAKAQAQQELDLLDSTSLNIAITGVTGAGKSSLVNALRGVQDDDKQNAAEVGVTETTKHPAQYPHPTFSNVVFWDLPGIGTPKFKAAKYLKSVNFSLYDFFIIVTRDRFTEHDVKLAHEIQKMGKKFYFVRTRVDDSLGAESRKQGFSEEATLEKIRSYCFENMKNAGESFAKIFLLSSWYPERYDFPLLKEAFENDLEGLKKQVLMMAMPAFSKEDLKKKKDSMNTLIWKLSLLSGAVGANPVPGVSFAYDILILVSGMKRFCRVFGLDEKSLERLAKRIGHPVVELKSAIKKSPLAGEIGKEFVIDRIARFALCSLSTALELVLDFIPIIGSVSGAGLSFVTTYYMLQSFLNDVVEDAESVCKKAKELSSRRLK